MPMNEREAKVLLVESDHELCMTLERRLRDQSHRVHAVTTKDQGLRMIYRMRPDLIIVGDDSLINVLTICQDIRRFVPDVPLMLLIPPDETVRLRGLSLGADECLPRTLAPSTLTQHAEALLGDNGSRSGPEIGARQEIDQRLTVDLGERRVLLNGNEQSLSPTEARLLAALLSKRGRTVSHENLIAAVWGSDQTDRMHSLKFYIWNLRQKIEATPATPNYIVTVRRQGYRFRRREANGG